MLFRCEGCSNLRLEQGLAFSLACQERTRLTFARGEERADVVYQVHPRLACFRGRKIRFKKQELRVWDALVELLDLRLVRPHPWAINHIASDGYLVVKTS